MFKLKPGNLFQKINKMDRKQAYTWGAIIVVCFIALITLASYMGSADDESFDDFNARGYDLAQMPFVNDEAEQYLLASKYPDMQGNGSTALYTAQEKEARQEEDAAQAEETSSDDKEDTSAVSSSSSSSNTSRGYRGYSGRGGGGSASPTHVGQLGSASMGRASGSGVGGSWGAPRGDFSPYKSQEKGSELPATLQNQNARKALSQFARGSQAAAGLKEGKAGNAKKALMGGNIEGSEAFTDSGVDLSKADGLNLDTNAPITSADLSNLDKDVKDAANKAKEKDEKEKQTLADKLKEQFLSSLVNLGMQSLGKLTDAGIDAMFSAGKAASENKALLMGEADKLLKVTDVSQVDALTKQQIAEATGFKIEDLDNLQGKSFLDVYKKSPKLTNETVGGNLSAEFDSRKESTEFDWGKWEKNGDKATRQFARSLDNSFTVAQDDSGNFISSKQNQRMLYNEKMADTRHYSNDRYKNSGSYYDDYNKFMTTHCKDCVVGSDEWNATETKFKEVHK